MRRKAQETNAVLLRTFCLGHKVDALLEHAPRAADIVELLQPCDRPFRPSVRRYRRDPGSTGPLDVVVVRPSVGRWNRFLRTVPRKLRRRSAVRLIFQICSVPERSESKRSNAHPAAMPAWCPCLALRATARWEVHCAACDRHPGPIRPHREPAARVQGTAAHAAAVHTGATVRIAAGTRCAVRGWAASSPGGAEAIAGWWSPAVLVVIRLPARRKGSDGQIAADSADRRPSESARRRLGVSRPTGRAASLAEAGKLKPLLSGERFRTAHIESAFARVEAGSPGKVAVEIRA